MSKLNTMPVLIWVFMFLWICISLTGCQKYGQDDYAHLPRVTWTWDISSLSFEKTPDLDLRTYNPMSRIVHDGGSHIGGEVIIDLKKPSDLWFILTYIKSHDYFVVRIGSLDMPMLVIQTNASSPEQLSGIIEEIRQLPIGVSASKNIVYVPN